LPLICLQHFIVSATNMQQQVHTNVASIVPKKTPRIEHLK